MFNSLRSMKVPPPALVAVIGVGGLGHLAIQFAHRMGYTVAAIGRGSSKADSAKQLGASHWIDNGKGDGAKQLQALGGADVIIATATDSKTTSQLIPGLSTRGVLLILGIDQKPIEVQALDMISGRRTLQGWPSGTAFDSQQTLDFAFKHQIKVTRTAHRPHYPPPHRRTQCALPPSPCLCALLRPWWRRFPWRRPPRPTTR